MACDFSPATRAGKWLGFFAAIWVQAISGNNFTFSNYSAALKTIMSLTQLKLNNLSVAKDVGNAFGIFAGLASDRLPPSLALLIGSVVGMVGYGVQWLVVSRRIQPLPYWAMCVFLFLGGNSATWMNTAILVTYTHNFSMNENRISGILRGYVLLSTAIFTDFCSALFADDPATFLLMLAIIPFVVCLAAVIFLRETTQSSSTDKYGGHGERRILFGVINFLAVAIAVYLMAYDLSGPHELRSSRIVFAVVLLILLATPISIPVCIARMSNMEREDKVEGDATENVEPLLAAVDLPEPSSDALMVVPDDLPSASDGEETELGRELTVLEAVKTVEFWILFVSFLCGVTGLAVMNNMGQIGSALGYSDISTFISLTSIWAFFGQYLFGSVHEFFLRKEIPRPVVNAASQILTALGYILLAAAVPGSLHVGAAVVGLCYGVRLATTIATTSELFGLNYHGIIYNIITLNLPLGSFIFSGLVAGILYDGEAAAVAGGGNTCVGAHCYRLVFHVMAVVCLVGLVFDVLLAVRTRRIYRRIYRIERLMRPFRSSFLSSGEW